MELQERCIAFEQTLLGDLPRGDPDREAFTLHIEDRGDNHWSIRWGASYMDAEGQWGPPGTRAYFDRFDMYRRSGLAQHTLRVNGAMAADVLAARGLA